MEEETQSSVQVEQESNTKQNHKPNNRKQSNQSRKSNTNQNASSDEKNASNAKQAKSKSRSPKKQQTPVDENLKAFVLKNQEVQKQRLNPHYKLDLNTNARVRITPLGGLGEIGGKIAVFETQNKHLRLVASL